MSLSLYFHTVRHLKPSQIYGRVLRSVWVPRPSEGPPPSRRKFHGHWVDPARGERKMTGPARFCFLNEVRDLDGKEGWNNSGVKKLWLYNLHYFDDLKAEGAGERQDWHAALIRRWIDENPPASGNGWEPFPTSLRIVNWLKWAFRGNILPENAVHSLAVQARWLERNLETHLLGNHLFSNAKALVFAGLFFEGEEAARWLSKGLALLRREVSEQILRDGGHYERSPMYHGMILEDLLDLINLSNTYRGGMVEEAFGGLVPSWIEAVHRMRAWLRGMSHPDGEIALFNDAAFGNAPSSAELDEYALRLGLGPAVPSRDGVTHFADSGYLRFQKEELVAILDLGILGPDYLPAHGHADTLSFEVSLWGQRVIVDTGTSCYEDCAERWFQRSTPAHNTVTVDGESSSEVWGSFRVARRAKPLGFRIDERSGVMRVECAHDGFRRLPGRAIHRRMWEFGENALKVTDVLEGGFRFAQGRFLLHPDLGLARKEARDRIPRFSHGKWVVPGGGIIDWRIDPGTGRFEDAVYCPRFGLSLETIRLEADFTGNECRLGMTWA